MPNHISNRISFKPLDLDNGWKAAHDALKELTALMKTDDSPFDFNVLIPYPERYATLDKAAHEAEQAAREKYGPKEMYLHFEEWNIKDGYNQGGYEWNIANWGTKWNAYDIGFDYDCILFNTAWATPKPIWRELSKRFPNLQLAVEYADEDRGHNCGILVYKNGELASATNENGLCDSRLFARAIIAEQREADTRQDLLKAEARIKELEAAVSPLNYPTKETE